MNYSSQIEKIAGYRFKKPSLLITAMTHPSARLAADSSECYERLEFLGDALLNFVIAEYLFKKFPTADEGVLTVMRSRVVSKKPLNEVVLKLKLDAYLITGSNSKFVLSEKVRSNIYEALAGAIYLDGGLAPASAFILRTLSGVIEKAGTGDTQDYKTKLIEYFVRNGISYEFKLIDSSGLPHKPLFYVRLYADGKPVAESSGKSKKSAEKACATIAYKIFELI